MIRDVTTSAFSSIGNDSALRGAFFLQSCLKSIPSAIARHPPNDLLTPTALRLNPHNDRSTH